LLQTSAGQEQATEHHQEEYAEEQHYQEEQHHEQEQPVYEEEPAEARSSSSPTAVPAEKDDLKFWSVNVRTQKPKKNSPASFAFVHRSKPSCAQKYSTCSFYCSRFDLMDY
jgi:hypothetical protein